MLKYPQKPFLYSLIFILPVICFINSGSWTSGVTSNHYHGTSWVSEWTNTSPHPNNHQHTLYDTLAAGSHSHSYTGSSSPLTWRSPYITLKYIMKVK